MSILKQTISTQVADAIRKRILSGELQGGYQLRQEHIAVEMGTSRIPVREALHQLHSEGFVTLVSHKGAIVSEISIEQIHELYELRARIETWLLALAIPHMTQEDFDSAAEHLAHLKKAAPDDNSSAVNWHEMNWSFHAALYKAARRPTTLGMVAKIHQQIERYTRMLVTFVGDQKKANDEHATLLKLCKDRDTLRAVNLLDLHIMEGGNVLVDRLTKLREGESQGAKKRGAAKAK